MIELKRIWTFTPNYTPRGWDERVRLLQTRILGTWYCLNRAHGKPVWETHFFRPNTIRALNDEVIAASEYREDGPWGYNFGCYGISMITGKLIWTSHAAGLWGRLLRMFDIVPEFTNEFRDTPFAIVRDEVFCQSGRVLDLKTGRDKRRITNEELSKNVIQSSDSNTVLHCGRGERTKVFIRDNMWLSERKSDHACKGDDFQMFLVDDNDGVYWRIDMKSRGVHFNDDLYQYHYAEKPSNPPYIYVIVSDEKNTRQDPYGHFLPNPTFFHLLSLDAVSGKVVSDFLVCDEKIARCRIESVDEFGMLISVDRGNRMSWTFQRQLIYYARSEEIR